MTIQEQQQEANAVSIHEALKKGHIPKRTKDDPNVLPAGKGEKESKGKGKESKPEGKGDTKGASKICKGQGQRGFKGFSRKTPSKDR